MAITVGWQGGVHRDTMANFISAGRVSVHKIGRYPMKKTLGIILCSAFSVGLVAETAVSIWSLANGQGVALPTAIELVVAWFVVLAVFIAAIVKGFLGSARWLGVGVVVHHDDSADSDDDDYDSEDAGEDEGTDEGNSEEGSEEGSEEHPADEPSENNQ
jgi:hypothetical protein